MSDLKDQLIKLGYTNPELRDHLRPVLDRLTQKSASRFTFRDLPSEKVDAAEKGLVALKNQLLKTRNLGIEGQGKIKIAGNVMSLRFQVPLEGGNVHKLRSLQSEVASIEDSLRQDADKELGNLEWIDFQNDDEVDSMMLHARERAQFIEKKKQEYSFVGVWSFTLLKDHLHWYTVSLEFGWEGLGKHNPLQRKYKKVISKEFEIQASEHMLYPVEKVTSAIVIEGKKLLPKI